MQIINYLFNDSILFLNETDKNQILKTMIAKAKSKDFIPNVEKFEQAIFERESIMSTDVGWQVAIPHAKLDGIKEFFIIPAVLSSEADWKAGNNQKVRLIFLIGGPSDNQKKYLQILSKVTLVVRNAERRQALLNSKTAEDFLSQFNDL